MKQKSFFTLLVGIVVVGGLIGGAFAGGIAIGKSQGEAEVNQELQSRMEQFSWRVGPGELPELEEDSDQGKEDPKDKHGQRHAGDDLDSGVEVGLG